MTDHIDRIRHMNQPPEKPAKTATTFAAKQKCCCNCAYWSPFKWGCCTLKDKHVSVYSICERHAEAK